MARVAKQMEREIGSILLSDKLILDVTKPTSDGPCLCSCTGVEITNDLQVVKVYVSVYTKDEEVRTKMLSRLSGLAGYALTALLRTEYLAVTKLTVLGGLTDVEGSPNQSERLREFKW